MDIDVRFQSLAGVETFSDTVPFSRRVAKERWGGRGRGEEERED